LLLLIKTKLAHELSHHFFISNSIGNMKWYQPGVSGSFPPPRYNHASALLASKLFVFGGFSRGAALNDLYVLDTGIQWHGVCFWESTSLMF
jgi:hypothetical protein